MKTVSVKINGVEYNLKGKENEEYLLDIAGYVDGKVREIGAKNKVLSSSSVAVLAAVNITDELFKCDQEVEELNKKKNSLEERHLTLRERIKELRTECDASIAERDKEIVALKTTIAATSEKLEQLDSLTKIAEEFEDAKKSLEELNKKVDEDKSYIASLLEEKKRDKEIILSLTDELKTYKDMISNDYIEKQEHLKALDTINQYEDKINQCNENIGELESIKELNIKEIESFKESNMKMKEKVQMYEKKEADYVKTKNSVEEVEFLKDKLSVVMEDNEKLRRMKKLIEDKHKENSFNVQNYKYKVLDLEKKLLDSQIMLAKERKDKNPLLTK
ncbi:MAG: cell division protein ZapA [Clostridium sp.]